MARLSKLKRQTNRSIRPTCQFCNAKLSISYSGNIYLDEDGHSVRVTSALKLSRAKYQECPKCRKRWPIYKRDEDAIEGPVIETNRTEERIGDESRRIENNTSATVQRTIRASREWTRQVQLGQAEGSHIAIGTKAAGLTSLVQKTIQKHYDVTVGEVQRFDEEISISVPVNTSIEVILRWKRIWQNGYLGPGIRHEAIPFKFCVGLTFDLQQQPLWQPPGRVDS